jgi:plastocyanin
VRRVLLLTLLGLLAAAPALAGASASRGTAVGVGEREWRVSLYRTKVPPGVVRLNAHNYGEDAHDLAVRNSAGRVLGHLSEIRPDRTDTLRVRLRRPGRYVVFCTLEGHETKGMRARLTVKKRAKS